MKKICLHVAKALFYSGKILYINISFTPRTTVQNQYLLHSLQNIKSCNCAVLEPRKRLFDNNYVVLQYSTFSRKLLKSRNSFFGNINLMVRASLLKNISLL